MIPADLKSIRQKLTWRDPPSHTPWILVLGPPRSGKTTFICRVLSLLETGSDDLPAQTQRTEGQQVYPLLLGNEQPQIYFLELPLTVGEGAASTGDACTIQKLEDLLDGWGFEACDKEASSTRKFESPPGFVVLVMKAAITNERDKHQQCLKHTMQRARTALMDSGIPSCVVLTHVEQTEPRLSTFVKGSPGSNSKLKEYECLGANLNRVFVVSNGKKKNRSDSDTVTLHTIAMDAIATDINHRVSTNPQYATASARQDSCKTENPEEQEGARSEPQKRRESFDLAKPDTWDCLGKEANCVDCDWQDNECDSHIICMKITGRSLQSKEQKGKTVVAVSKDACLQVVGVLNALLNSNRGRVTVHLESWLHAKFMEQISDKMVGLIPGSSSYDDTYEKKISDDGNHILIRVRPPSDGGRHLSTMDFKIKMSTDRGLKIPTQDQMKELMNKSQKQPLPNIYDRGYGNPTSLSYDKIVPFWMTESKNCQMKAVRECDFAPLGSKREETFSKYVFDMIQPYVCSFALLETGGNIYLALGETKTPQSSKSEEGEKTGKFTCKGIKLRLEERRFFENYLSQQTEKMLFVGERPTNLTHVKYIPVKGSPEGSEAEVCVVNVEVRHQHGIIWPDLEGPLAFRAIRAGDSSKVVKIAFEEWKKSF